MMPHLHANADVKEKAFLLTIFLVHIQQTFLLLFNQTLASGNTR